MARRVLLTAGRGVFVVGMIVQATGPDFAAVTIGRVLAVLGVAADQATGTVVVPRLIRRHDRPPSVTGQHGW